MRETIYFYKCLKIWDSRMTIESNDRDSLIKYRLKQADETILDVRLLIENNRLRSAVNRVYYGMFYSLLALGLANKFETSTYSVDR